MPRGHSKNTPSNTLLVLIDEYTVSGRDDHQYKHLRVRIRETDPDNWTYFVSPRYERGESPLRTHMQWLEHFSLTNQGDNHNAGTSYAWRLSITGWEEGRLCLDDLPALNAAARFFKTRAGYESPYQAGTFGDAVAQFGRGMGAHRFLFRPQEEPSTQFTIPENVKEYINDRIAGWFQPLPSAEEA